MPYFTGKIIDYASIEPDRQMFQQTALKLVGVAFGCAVFTGVRGGLFTLGMARLNLRIRTNLFDSLLRQDIGFFDTTKTGEITSRLLAASSMHQAVCASVFSLAFGVLLGKEMQPEAFDLLLMLSCVGAAGLTTRTKCIPNFCDILMKACSVL